MSTMQLLVPAQVVHANMLICQLMMRHDSTAQWPLALDGCEHVDVKKGILSTHAAFLQRKPKRLKAMDSDALRNGKLQTPLSGSS